MLFLRSATIFASWTAVSRVLGLARDILFAITLGATGVADAFIFAYRFPHLFRTILAEGAMASAFIPIYEKRRQSNLKKLTTPLTAAKTFAGATLVILLITTCSIVVIMLTTMPQIVAILAAGFKAINQKYILAVELSRIAILYLPLVAITALLCSILSAHGFFALYGAMPVILNAAIIAMLIPAALLSINPETIAPIILYTLVAVGLIQVYLAYNACTRINAAPIILNTKKIDYKVKKDRKNFLILFAAAIGGHGFVQITFLVNQFFASKMQEGTIAATYYAERLVHLPIGIIAVAITNALLPEISRLCAKNNKKQLAKTQNEAFIILLAIAIPCAVGLATLNQHIVFTLFEYGEFSTNARIRAANILKILALALPAFAILKPMLAVLFAFQKSRWVLLLSILSLSVNVILVYNLVHSYGYIGIPTAISIAAWVNLSAICAVLIKYKYWKITKNFITKIVKIIIAASIMWIALKACTILANQQQLLDNSIIIPTRIAILTIMIAIPSGVYAIAIFATKIFSYRELQQWKNLKK